MISMLIVDDEEEIGEFLMDFAREQGITDLKAVLTGEEAIKTIQKKEWQIAMVDLKLSTSVSGLDVIRAIKERSPKTFVIAMTGYVDIDLRQKAEKLQVDDFIEKPDGLKPQNLAGKISKIIK